jgi:hypothetical protein
LKSDTTLHGFLKFVCELRTAKNNFKPLAIMDAADDGSRQRSRSGVGFDMGVTESAGWMQAAGLVIAYLTVVGLAYFANAWYFSELAAPTVPESNVALWDFIGTSSAAAVDTYTRRVPGTKLLAFKGALVVNSHIADVLNAYADVKRTPDWVDLLKIMYTLPVEAVNSATVAAATTKKGLFSRWFGRQKGSSERKASTPSTGNNILADNPYQTMLSDVVYQYYELPWPVAPRDFVFLRTINVYGSERSVTIRVASTMDSRRPPVDAGNTSTQSADGRALNKHTIRAESPFSDWLFQDLGAFCQELRTYGDHKSTAVSTTTEGNTGTKSGHQRSRASAKEAIRNPRRDSYYHDHRANVVKVCADLRRKESNSTSRNSGERRTYVEIEALVDNKGSLPAWFVNYVQR